MDEHAAKLLTWCTLIAMVLIGCVSITDCASDEHRLAKRINDSRSQETRLLTDLFKEYDDSVRPVFNGSHSVLISFGVTLVQIMDMDERNQVLVTNMWLEHLWKDERLIWDPGMYGNISVVRIHPKKIWKPDIVLYNNADDYTAGYLDVNVVLYAGGDVYWSPPARLRSSCKVDVSLFPFDNQTCNMKFGSWTYEKSQVDIKFKSSKVDLSNYVKNGAWAITSTDIVRNEVTYPISDAFYPDVTVHIYMRRRVLYYVLNIIFPCLWLNVLSLLPFCLPPESGEKITLGITVLLSYSVFTLLIAENMPETSEFVPLISLYLTVSMAVTAISVIMTVFVLKIHHVGPHPYKVPSWVRSFMLGRLARLLKCDVTGCLRKAQKKHQKAGHFESQTSGQPENRDSYVFVHKKDRDTVCLRLASDTKESPRTYKNAGGIETDFGIPLMSRGSSSRRQKDTGSPVWKMRDDSPGWSSPPSRHKILTHQPYSSPGPTCASTSQQQATVNELLGQTALRKSERARMRSERTMQEIIAFLKVIVSKSDEQENRNEILDEWRLLAELTDRLLFFVFLTTTGVFVSYYLIFKGFFIQFRYDYDDI